MSKISFEDKIKNHDLNNFVDLQPDLDLKAVLNDIKHWKADLYQLEAKQRVQKLAIQKTYNDIKAVKHKIKLWSDKIACFQTFK